MNLIGSKVEHTKFGKGVIVEVRENMVVVNFNGDKKSFIKETLNKYLTFEDSTVNDCVKELIQKIKDEKTASVVQEQAEEDRKIAKVTENIENCGAKIVGKDVITVQLERAYTRYGKIEEPDKAKIQAVFRECDNDSESLFYEFNPKMVYPEITSRPKRSEYCVGFLCKYLDTYVIRVFLRRDSYKKGVRKGVTILQSDTTEILRALRVNDKNYYFNKNKLWVPYGMPLILNEVIRYCDCAYLNDYISEKNIENRLYIDLLLPALTDNKVELVFKQKLFSSAHNIKDIAKYLKEFSSKQIQFVCEHNLLNALPFIKKHGIYDLDILKKMEMLMKSRYCSMPTYKYLKDVLKKLRLPDTEMDKRLIDFLRKVDHFDVLLYQRYIQLLPECEDAVSISDFFDVDYVERYQKMAQQRPLYSYGDEIDYKTAAEKLSWIDREENGYFIIVPKSIFPTFKATPDCDAAVIILYIPVL